MGAWPAVQGIISDLDGVVYRGEAPIDDAVAMFRRCQACGIPFCFVTNNSTVTAMQVVERLDRFGLSIGVKSVLTSAMATARIVRRDYSEGTRVYVIGARSLVNEIAGAGMEITDREPEIVVVGLDREINYSKLRVAVRAVVGGARLIGTNPDLLLPMETGLDPGAGSLLAAVATAAGAVPLIVGKPEPLMVEMALSALDTPRHATLMIGDQLATDIQAGKRAGLYSVLVTSGVPPEENPALLQPDSIVQSLAGIPIGGQII